MKNNILPNIKDLDFSDIKFTSNSVFEKFSNTELKRIIKEYYSDKKITDILNNIDINIRPNDFYKNLPLINTKIKCPYDKNDMFAQLPSKSNIQNWDKDVICPKCGHMIFNKTNFYDTKECDCSNCIKKRKLDAENKLEIIKKVNEEYSAIDYSSLSMEDVLDIATILNGFNSLSLENIGIYDNNHNLDFDSKILVRLANKNLILVSESSPAESIEKYTKTGYSYYVEKVNWNINVKFSDLDSKDLLNLLKNPNKGMNYNFDSKESNKLYLNIIDSEMLRLFEMEFNDLALSFDKDTNKDAVKITDMINRLLVSWSPSQIYAFIWQAVRKADNSRTRNVWGNYRYHQVDFVIKLIDDIIINNRNANNSNKEFNYPFKITPYLRTQIFFNQMMILPDWFNSLVPLKLNEDLESIPVKIMVKSLDKQVNDITNLSTILDNAKWYTISDLGIVVFDGTNKKLFSNELTVFNIYREFGSDWLNIAKSDYLLTNFYSFFYLSSLQTLLEHSKVECNNNDDEKF